MPTESDPSTQSFVGRVFNNEAARRGLASAVAGVLIAAVLELWTAKN